MLCTTIQKRFFSTCFVAQSLNPSDVPSDVQSDVPSDIQSVVPNDVPSDVPSNGKFFFFLFCSVKRIYDI